MNSKPSIRNTRAIATVILSIIALTLFGLVFSGCTVGPKENLSQVALTGSNQSAVEVHEDGFSVPAAWLDNYCNMARIYKYGCKLYTSGLHSFSYRWKKPLDPDDPVLRSRPLPGNRYHVSTEIYSQGVQMNVWRHAPYDGADSGVTILDTIMEKLKP